MSKERQQRLCWLAVALLCLASVRLWGQETTPVVRCTLTVGAYECSGSAACHTWAVFTRTCAGRTERLTISWMPAGAGKVRLLHQPVPGENWSEERTLRQAASYRTTVYLWGPYPVTEQLWQQACRRKVELDSGKVYYCVLDHKTRPYAINCIHAVSDLVEVPLRTGLAYGVRASALVLEHLLYISR